MTRIEALEDKVRNEYLNYLAECNQLRNNESDYLAKEEAYRKYKSNVKDLESEIASLGGVI
ncbi:hypothetical protein [Romboutsia sp.]|uniref:hypothetical protein n=1 Tax=Romboutsia sp. TaxID=1965302 RepID=UPI002B6CA727|nr:hypothetical protein [Romboutsia sp.]HSQ90331.1 hypothetical protein [Romboutsia sp.]